tara:strand:+ start:3142 stop:3939 length:798 start_codon:yes stop_codon:yes gene_type:complete
MNEIKEKYKFLKPHLCEDLKRLGRNHDGGYVVSFKSIINSNYLISFGLGSDWSFELDYLKFNNNGKVLIYDHTINFKTFFYPFIKCIKRFLTFRKNIKDVKDRFNELSSYYKLINKKNVNYFKKKIDKTSTNKEESLKNILEKNPSIKKFILKVDIEGSEFNIIDEIIYFSNNIDMLIIEFHDLDKYEKKFYEEIIKLTNHFNIIHIHGNNHCNINDYGLPIATELTLLNKNYNLKKIKEKISFPLKKLDCPNNPNLDDIKFTFK